MSDPGAAPEPQQPPPRAAKRDLTLPTTVFSTAVALGSLAVSQAGLNDPWLIAVLSVSAVALFLASIFWTWLVARISLIRRATAFVSANVRARFSVRAVGVLALLLAVYVVASVASQPRGGTPVEAVPPRPPAARAPGSGPDFSSDPDLPEPPPGRTRVQRAYLTDFTNNLRTYRDLHFEEAEGNRRVRVNSQRVINFESNVDFVAFYIPFTTLAPSIFAYVAEHIDDIVDDLRNIRITMQEHGDPNQFGGKDMKFSGVLYFYTENPLSIEEMADLRRTFREKGITAHFRHPGTLRPDGHGP